MGTSGPLTLDWTANTAARLTSDLKDCSPLLLPVAGPSVLLNLWNDALNKEPTKYIQF